MAQKEDEVVRYGMANGYSLDEIKMAVSDKRMAATIFKAFMFDQMQKQAPSKPKTAPVAPVTTVKARSAPAAKNPDKMSPEEWMKWRTAQVKRR